METIKTTRVRREWVSELREKYGTDADIGRAMGVDKATAWRWLNGTGEATPRFIGAVLLSFPVSFDEAFICVEEVAERRAARIYKRATGQPAKDAA